MNTAVNDACALGAELSLYDTIVPFSANAAEQRAVDVSISMILSRTSSLLVPEKQVLQVREYGIGRFFEWRKED